MNLRSVVSAICIFAFAGIAQAHGGFQHVMGTVKSISPNSITVLTAGATSKEVTVVVLPSTKFEKSGIDSSLKELKEGDRVVIHAKPDGDKMDAVTVAFGKSWAPSNASAAGMGNMQH